MILSQWMKNWSGTTWRNAFLLVYVWLSLVILEGCGKDPMRNNKKENNEDRYNINITLEFSCTL